MSENKYGELLDEVAEIYLELRERQGKIVFASKTEKEADQERKKALAFVTTRLSDVLTKRGDSRGEK